MKVNAIYKYTRPALQDETDPRSSRECCCEKQSRTMTGDGTAAPPVGVTWGDEQPEKDGLTKEAMEEEDAEAKLSLAGGLQSRSMMSLPPEPFMIMRSKVWTRYYFIILFDE